ncbi:hypothetical protein BDV93DRAFT_515902 [Ceratobasidium sp. AG-I]|nr:hypothetical protein BDV93DRAFT_515902 [Ceratobasidium sp. AG-I]
MSESRKVTPTQIIQLTGGRPGMAPKFRGSCLIQLPQISKELLEGRDNPELWDLKHDFHMWKELINLQINSLILSLCPYFHQLMKKLKLEQEQTIAYLLNFGRCCIPSSGMTGGVDTLYLVENFIGGDVATPEWELLWSDGLWRVYIPKD